MIIKKLDQVPSQIVEMEGVLVAPHELHQFRNAGDEPFRFICAVPKEYE
jgi:quercetin dioxygenase-like cupin family protein